MKLWRKVRDSARGVADSVVPRPGGDPGGEPARGVVVELLQGPWHTSDDTKALWSAVTMRLRRADDPASPAVTVQQYLKPRAWRAIDVGQDVPVRVDGATGAVLGLDCDAYETDVDAGVYKPVVEVPDMAPTDESLAPIEGVTLETWVAVLAGVAKQMIGPTDQDAFAASHGVPAGRWAAVNAAWQQRANSDWKVGMRFGETYQAAMQRDAQQ